MLHLLLVIFTFFELNCENLFDVQHDAGKQDEEFLPASSHHWTPYRYWRKLQGIGQDIAACGEVAGGLLPDMGILTEVENDSVMRDLTRRSILRTARYKYVMTSSPDARGIDVAFLYSPFSFRLLTHHSIRIPPLRGFSPTRDILYAAGLLADGDTLHVFGIHAPSRTGGKTESDSYRKHVVSQLALAVDSVERVSHEALIIIAGDFNDLSGDASLKLLERKGLVEVSLHARGMHGAKGTYRYQGSWGSLDHIFCSPRLAQRLKRCSVSDAPFLLEEDKKYGGVKPHRTFLGPVYVGGISDHLPIVAGFE